MPDILYPTHKLFEATQILVHASTEDVARLRLVTPRFLKAVARANLRQQSVDQVLRRDNLGGRPHLRAAYPPGFEIANQNAWTKF